MIPKKLFNYDFPIFNVEIGVAGLSTEKVKKYENEIIEKYERRYNLQMVFTTSSDTHQNRICLIYSPKKG